MNKRVLVTGSTKGIGQGILNKFHAENWDVCITGRDDQHVTKIQKKLIHKYIFTIIKKTLEYVTN
jgi:short-subunit dehydrogenase